MLLPSEGLALSPQTDFATDVAEWLADTRPVDPDKAVRCVFGLLTRHISEGQIAKVRDALPKSLRQMWDSADTAALDEEPLILTEQV